MSSVASQRAMLITLGGVSIAALFVWYIQAKRSDTERKKNILSDKSKKDITLTSSKESSDVSDTIDESIHQESVGTDSMDVFCANTSVLDISHNPVEHEESSCSEEMDISQNPVKHEHFSWSEEMEKSGVEQQQENEHIKLDTNNQLASNDSSDVASDNSEASSEDSGCAIGGFASYFSPIDEVTAALPMYEFEIPNTLVGLVIGIKGKTIKELSVRTSVKMLIRQHHTPEKVNTHQICQVRGKREEINKCLHMLRNRFPPARFPDLDLQPVLPPPFMLQPELLKPCYSN